MEGLRRQKAGLPEQAIALYRAALELTDDPALISEALQGQAHAYRIRCEWDEAADTARRSVRIAEQTGLPDLLAEALNAEAAVHQSRGDFALAIPLYRRILQVAQDVRIRGVALQNLAGVYASQGDLESAERYFHEAYECFERVGYAWGKAHVLNNLGRVALDRGNFAAAEDILERATAVAKQIDDLELLAVVRINQAEALLARGELERAEEAASAAVGHLTTTGNEWRRIEALRLLGDLNVRRGAGETARRFYSAALRVAEAIGAKLEREQLRSRLAALEEGESGKK